VRLLLPEKPKKQSKLSLSALYPPLTSLQANIKFKLRTIIPYFSSPPLDLSEKL
jgi:hypothetical protein